MSFVPPLNFAQVLPGVYRSGYPNKRNHGFLKKLKLKSILYLCPDSYTKDNEVFVNEEDIRFFHCQLSGNKEPFVEIDRNDITKALSIILDTENHPILVHCNKGKHRVGCVVAALRKIHGWSLTSIFDEYERFAGAKVRIADLEFIELFVPNLSSITH
ncbi:tyrosine phosphatase putative [Rozella allomycis CSF55]|uniref:Tyrosine phosphatase putative n=1 Tax=Rozella allomycis (strain CSF55) TaxID=988480 RepID=A0A4P9YPY2_ROZAC|nr:tyrosine phosphatase putative [Rozella allomycis CSF55]